MQAAVSNERALGVDRNDDVIRGETRPEIAKDLVLCRSQAEARNEDLVVHDEAVGVADARPVAPRAEVHPVGGNGEHSEADPFESGDLVPGPPEIVFGHRLDLALDDVEMRGDRSLLVAGALDGAHPRGERLR